MSPAEKQAREEMAERKMQDAAEKAYSKSLTTTEYAPEKKDPRDAVRGQKGYAKGGMAAKFMSFSKKGKPAGMKTVAKMASGGSASKRADGIATKGKTRGKMC
jgi:hypothetical protein